MDRLGGYPVEDASGVAAAARRRRGGALLGRPPGAAGLPRAMALPGRGRLRRDLSLVFQSELGRIFVELSN